MNKLSCLAGTLTITLEKDLCFVKIFLTFSVSTEPKRLTDCSENPNRKKEKNYFSYRITEKGMQKNYLLKKYRKPIFVKEKVLFILIFNSSNQLHSAHYIPYITHICPCPDLDNCGLLLPAPVQCLPTPGLPLPPQGHQPPGQAGLTLPHPLLAPGQQGGQGAGGGGGQDTALLPWKQIIISLEEIRQNKELGTCEA